MVMISISYRSIFSGIIDGNLALIRKGLQEGGNVKAILDPFLGFLQLHCSFSSMYMRCLPTLRRRNDLKTWTR